MRHPEYELNILITCRKHCGEVRRANSTLLGECLCLCLGLSLLNTITTLCFLDCVYEALNLIKYFFTDISSGARDIAERLSIVKKKKEDDWLTRTLEELSNAPPAKQCAVGAAAGAYVSLLSYTTNYVLNSSRAYFKCIREKSYIFDVTYHIGM